MRTVLKHSLAVLVLVAFAVPAAAAAKGKNPQKPGKWKLEMQMEVPGMEMKMPPMTSESCVTEEDLSDPQKAVPTDPESDCEVDDYKVAGNTVTWAITCPKQQMKGDGKITYSEESYAGTMNMLISGQAMKMKYRGKYLGKCAKEAK